MKNYKTTLAGLLAALPIVADALLTAYNAVAFTDKLWAITNVVGFYVSSPSGGVQ